MIEELRRELAAVGIPRPLRERIVAEIADHLACDPEADLGEPRELAQRFADELGAGLARRAAAWTFVGLALAAPLLLAPLFLIGTYPDIAGGRSPVLTALAFLALFVGAQIAFVAGSLAAVRAWRVRREPTVPAAEVGLLRSRSLVGAVAGLAAAGGLALYTVNFWAELPLWWRTVGIACAVAASIPLAAASAAIVRAGAPVVRVAGPAGDLSRDLGPAAAQLGPRRVAAVAGAAVVVLAFASGSVGEASLAEGALRGGFEAVAFAAAYLALGRTVGAR